MSFELRDEPQLSLHVERVMQPERSAQLTHAQMPLQRFGVVWKRESLVALLAQRNRFTQTVYELKRGEEQSVSESNTSQEADQQTLGCGSVVPERVGQQRAGGGISLGR